MTFCTPRYFRTTLVKGGAPVAIKIFYGGPIDPLTGDELDRSPRWQVWLLGVLQEEIGQFILHFEPDGTPVIKGEEISHLDHEYLLALHAHAVQYDPTMPEADPRKPVELRKMAPVLPPR